MGWEKRGNSDYYYRKVRIGERVQSKYIGHGELVEVFLETERLRKRKNTDQRRLEKSEEVKIVEEARVIRSLRRSVMILTNSLLVVNGFHTHNGQWRMKRVK